MQLIFKPGCMVWRFGCHCSVPHVHHIEAWNTVHPHCSSRILERMDTPVPVFTMTKCLWVDLNVVLARRETKGCPEGRKSVEQCYNNSLFAANGLKQNLYYGSLICLCGLNRNHMQSDAARLLFFLVLILLLPLSPLNQCLNSTLVLVLNYKTFIPWWSGGCRAVFIATL